MECCALIINWKCLSVRRTCVIAYLRLPRLPNHKESLCLNNYLCLHLRTTLWTGFQLRSLGTIHYKHFSPLFRQDLYNGIQQECVSACRCVWAFIHIYGAINSLCLKTWFTRFMLHIRVIMLHWLMMWHLKKESSYSTSYLNNFLMNFSLSIFRLFF